MSENQRRDARASGDARAAEATRDAKIEQLLLTGLDHYFAAEYEQAINVWTRALFFDRSHPRARAYIERARSALAERQRQSEELLHNGVAAFHRGEGDEARRLLQAAIDGGAPPDEALTILERINRTVQARAELGESGKPPLPRRARRVKADKSIGQPRSLVRLTLATVSVVGILALGGYIVSASRPDWQLLLPFLSLAEPASSPTVAPVPQDLTLPLPRRGEMALARGRALVAGGRLHEALAALGQVRATDPQKEEADRLRAEIQRQLLALTPMPAPPAPGPERRVP